VRDHIPIIVKGVHAEPPILSAIHYTAISHCFLTFDGGDLISVKRKDGSCADSSANLTINTTERISSLSFAVEDSSISRRRSNTGRCRCPLLTLRYCSAVPLRCHADELLGLCDAAVIRTVGC